MAHLNRLTKAAVAAMHMTAEQLGVDPLVLADWLEKDQLLANTMFLLGQRGTLTEHRAEMEAALLNYFGFLEYKTEPHHTTRGEAS